MSAFQSLGSIFHILAIILAVIGGLLLLLSLFWDRSKKRRRCPKCWYDMSAVSNLLCPECGRTARRERSLYKTRRSPRAALIAVFLLLAAHLANIAPTMSRVGIVAAIPTPILITILDLESWPRPTGAGIPPPMRPPVSNYRALFLDGGPLPPPAAPTPTPAPSPPSKPLSNELLRRLEENSLGWSKSWALRRIIQRWALEYRTLWPENAPLCVRPTGVPLFGTTGFRLWGRIARQTPPPPWKDLTGEWFTNSSREWNDGMVELGSFPNPRSNITIEFILRNSSARDPVWTGSASLPIRIRGTVADLLTPVASAEIDQDIKQALPLDWSAGTHSFQVPTSASGQSAGITTAIRFEFLEKGQLVATASVWDNTGQTVAGMTVPIGLPGELPVRWLPVPDISLGRQPKIDAVRIVADPDVALRNFACTRYWSGAINVPASIPPQ